MINGVFEIVASGEARCCTITNKLIQIYVAGRLFVFQKLFNHRKVFNCGSVVAHIFDQSKIEIIEHQPKFGRSKRILNVVGHDALVFVIQVSELFEFGRRVTLWLRVVKHLQGTCNLISITLVFIFASYADDP